MIKLSDIALLMMEYVNEGWENKNHPATGRFQDSLRYETVEEGDIYRITIYGNEYGVYMNKGIPASSVKNFYSPPTGRGGTSEYIQSLNEWVQVKLGVSPTESLGVAFAIANTHWEEGIVSNSNPYKKYDEGGTGWLDEVKEEKYDEIKSMIQEYIKQNLFL